MSYSKHTSESATVGDALRHAYEIGLASKVQTVGPNQVAVVPYGWTVDSVPWSDPNDQAPVDLVRHVLVDGPADFSAYVKQHHLSGFHVFADREEGGFVGVMDYGTNDDPDRGRHRVTLKLRHSDAFKAWNGIMGKAMDQVDFAEFVDENAIDVVEPDSADLVEVAHQLHVTRNASFSGLVKSTQMTYAVHFDEQDGLKTKNRGDITFPSRVVLSIPVFDGTEPMKVPVSLRYKLNGGALSFVATWFRPDAVREEAFRKVADQVAVEMPQGGLFLRGKAPEPQLVRAHN